MSETDKQARYQGGILNCIKHGSGSYIYPGEVFQYDGEWSNGVKNGQNSRFDIKNFSSYQGSVKDGEITGKGERKWSDGRVYSGDWYLGEMHGKGRWVSSNGSEVYEGEFISNKRQGNGYLKLSNGDVYNGSFSAHRYHGSGSYLRENCFSLEGTFIRGILCGYCSVQWHKLSSYQGPFVKNRLSGRGHFKCLDGSYECDTDFVNNTIVYSNKAFGLKIDRSMVIEEDAKPEGKGKDKKEKKKPGKKGSNVDQEALCSVPPGSGLGACTITLEANNPTGTPILGIVPNPGELRRAITVCLREYLPPDIPPSKGAHAHAQAVVDPNSEKELGEVIQLWRREKTLEEGAASWDRFPCSCRRYINGENILRADDKIHLEGESTSFSPTGTGKASVIAASVSSSEDSYAWVAIRPAELRGSDISLSFIADLRFMVSRHSLATCPTHVISGRPYHSLQILDFSHVLAGMEMNTRSSLVLSLLKPCEGEEGAEEKGEEQQEGEILAETWQACMWELRLVENQPGDPRSTLIARWSDIGAFRSDHWHSISLTLRSAQASVIGRENSSLSSLVDLVVDGSGRMKIANSGLGSEDSETETGDREDTVGAWLPSADQSESDDVRLLMRVGKGSGVGAMIKNIIICSKYDWCDPMASTSAYADWYARESSSLLSSNSPSPTPPPGTDGEDLQPAPPPGMQVISEIPLVCCGGRAYLEPSIILPPHTLPGLYIVEISDAANPQCVRDEQSVSQASRGLSPSASAGADAEEGDAPPSSLLDLSGLYRMVPAAIGTKSTFKINVM